MALQLRSALCPWPLCLACEQGFFNSSRERGRMTAARRALLKGQRIQCSTFCRACKLQHPSMRSCRRSGLVTCSMGSVMMIVCTSLSRRSWTAFTVTSVLTGAHGRPLVLYSSDRANTFQRRRSSILPSPWIASRDVFASVWQQHHLAGASSVPLWRGPPNWRGRNQAAGGPAGWDGTWRG